METKQYGVFGLGDFGKSVAMTLAQNGCQVLAVDIHEEEVQAIADYVTMAVRMDVRDLEGLRGLGLGNLDGVIVGLSSNLEASIMVAFAAEEAKVPYILAKAHNEVQATVLRRVGVDDVIFPEVAMGMRIAKGIMNGGKFVDLFALSDDFSIVEVKTQPAWIGKSLRELKIRNHFNINVIGKKSGKNVDMYIDPDAKMKPDETWIMIGDNKLLDKMVE